MQWKDGGSYAASHRELPDLRGQRNLLTASYTSATTYGWRRMGMEAGVSLIIRMKASVDGSEGERRAGPPYWMTLRNVPGTQHLLASQKTRLPSTAGSPTLQRNRTRVWIAGWWQGRCSSQCLALWPLAGAISGGPPKCNHLFALGTPWPAQSWLHPSFKSGLTRPTPSPPFAFWAWIQQEGWDQR